MLYVAHWRIFDAWEMAIHSGVYAASQPWEVLINILVLE
jgi:hypothetical protein